MILKADKHANLRSPFTEGALTRLLPSYQFYAPTFLIHSFKVCMETCSFFKALSVAGEKDRDLRVGSIRQCPEHPNLKTLIVSLLLT